MVLLQDEPQLSSFGALLNARMLVLFQYICGCEPTSLYVSFLFFVLGFPSFIGLTVQPVAVAEPLRRTVPGVVASKCDGERCPREEDAFLVAAQLRPKLVTLRMEEFSSFRRPILL